MGFQYHTEDNEAVHSLLQSLSDNLRVPVLMYACKTGEDTFTIKDWLGLRTPALHNLEVSTGLGLGGGTVETSRPLAVEDYLQDPRISHDYDRYIRDEALNSLFAIPVTVGREVVGILYAGVHRVVRFGDRVLEELILSSRELEQKFAISQAARQSSGTSQNGQRVTGPEWEQVRSAHSRLRVLASKVTDKELKQNLEELCDQMISPVKSKSTTQLSAREIDVLSCVAMGYTNAETAQEMGIGAETVKSYLRSVMRKLDAHTRYEAVNVARRIGALP